MVLVWQLSKGQVWPEALSSPLCTATFELQLCLLPNILRMSAFFVSDSVTIGVLQKDEGDVRSTLRPWYCTASNSWNPPGS